MRKIMIASLISLIIIISTAILYKLRDGNTPPILDENGRQLPGSISTLEKVELGGMEQWILIRAKDVSNPILLWLHGGPGAAQMPVARYFNGELEDHFVVVHWDQRGAGKSNPPDFDESTMTFQQFLDDAHELTLYLKTRFSQDKIYLVGHSWGSQLGIKLAQAYPQDYYAYIGISQVVDPAFAQDVGYAWLMEQVKSDKNEKKLRELESLGPPPFTDHEKFVRYVKLIDAYGGDFDIGMGKLLWVALRAPEYRLSDLLAWFKGANRGSGPMWNTTEYQSFNTFEDVPRIEIPVYFFNGLRDYNTPLLMIDRYYGLLDAPLGKELVIFDFSAHTPFMGEAKKFNQELIKVIDETQSFPLSP